MVHCEHGQEIKNILPAQNVFSSDFCFCVCLVSDPARVDRKHFLLPWDTICGVCECAQNQSFQLIQRWNTSSGFAEMHTHITRNRISTSKLFIAISFVGEIEFRSADTRSKTLLWYFVSRIWCKCGSRWDDVHVCNRAITKRTLNSIGSEAFLINYFQKSQLTPNSQ